MAWRHKKSGGVYEIISDSAMLQCSTDPDVEERYPGPWTVYRHVSGKVFIRLTAEFMDGRFEEEIWTPASS